MEKPTYSYSFILAMALLGSLIASVGIWVPFTSFPFTPLLNSLAPAALNFYRILFLAFIALTLAFAYAPSRKKAAVLAVLIGTGFVLNLNTMRPDFYHYLVVLILIVIAGNSLQYLDEALPLIHAATYLWTGLFKFNSRYLYYNQNFIEQVWQPLLPFHVHHWFLWIIPVTELLIGYMFLRGIRTKMAFVLSVILHACIVLQLIFAHWNEAMIPYNIFLAAGNYYLFVQRNSGDILESLRARIKHIPALIVSVLYLLLPVLNFAYLWPHYLSCDMYSGRGKYSAIKVNDDIVNGLPLSAVKYVHATDSTYNLDVVTWMQSETNCVPNPEGFVYTRLQQKINSYAVPDTVTNR